MNPWNLLVWILFGLVAGALVVGGYIGTLLGLGRGMQFDCYSLVLAVLGTCTLLAIYRLIQRR
jgi:uncharacterized membrane protein YeaQ/YmgE (transglycosylase-associated protein family)